MYHCEARWLVTVSEDFFRTAAVLSEEFVKRCPNCSCVLKALNVAGLADSGVLAKLLIDDSVTERKLSPMHNS